MYTVTITSNLYYNYIDLDGGLNSINQIDNIRLIDLLKALCY